MFYKLINVSHVSYENEPFSVFVLKHTIVEHLGSVSLVLLVFMNPSLPCLPRKPPSKEPSEEEDWFLTSDELQQALLSDNNNNFDIRVVHLLVTMFSSDAAGTLDLSEFREMWNYVDQWKVIFETYQNELPMTMDRFQSTLSQMGFRYVYFFFQITQKSEKIV